MCGGVSDKGRKLYCPQTPNIPSNTPTHEYLATKDGDDLPFGDILRSAGDPVGAGTMKKSKKLHCTVFGFWSPHHMCTSCAAPFDYWQVLQFGHTCRAEWRTYSLFLYSSVLRHQTSAHVTLSTRASHVLLGAFGDDILRSIILQGGMPLSAR